MILEISTILCACDCGRFAETLKYTAACANKNSQERT